MRQDLFRLVQQLRQQANSWLQIFPGENVSTMSSYLRSKTRVLMGQQWSLRAGLEPSEFVCKNIELKTSVVIGTTMVG